MPQISYSGIFFVKYIFIIISLLNRCFPEEVDPVPPNNIFINGAFIHLHGYASKGPKLGRQTCWSLLRCAHLCLKYPKCSSVNYQVSEARNGLCELSEEGIASNEERIKLNKMPGFVFVQIMRKDLKPKSCLEQLWTGARYSGYYRIFNDEGHSFPVYCDLTSDANAAWTLFMSERTPGLNVFKALPLYVDKPTNEDNPNWDLFRVSLNNMKQLRSRSSHWRVTCSFQTDGVVFRDYVRAKIADFDPIDFEGLKSCKRVEYINVRGHTCTDCDVPWWQDNRQMLHHDSSSAGCGFDASSGAVGSEDNFGFYNSFNTNFRCTQMPGSTTNYWFGSYLK
ncbi:uncharacterized protein LOC144655593 [Oculina patagonica]